MSIKQHIEANKKARAKKDKDSLGACVLCLVYFFGLAFFWLYMFPLVFGS